MNKQYIFRVLFVISQLIFFLNSFAAALQNDVMNEINLADLMREDLSETNEQDIVRAQYELAQQIGQDHLGQERSLVVPLVFFILKVVGSQAVKVIHKIVDSNFLKFMEEEAEKAKNVGEQIIDSSFLQKFFQIAYPKVAEAIHSLTGKVANLTLEMSKVQEEAKHKISQLTSNLHLEELAKQEILKIKSDIEGKVAVLEHIIHPSFLSVGLTGATFFVKSVYNFTFKKNISGSKKLKNQNELRIQNIIIENTGTTFKKIKIRANSLGSNYFNQNISYVKNGSDEFLFVKSENFVESLSDDELKYAVLRELLFVKYDYEIKKFMKALILAPVVSYLLKKLGSQYFGNNNVLNHAKIAACSIVIFELAHYLLNYSDKIKDEIYIYTFGSIPDLKAAILYYKKAQLSRYARNSRVKLFKDELSKFKQKDG